VKKAIELLEKAREMARGFMVVENLEKYEELRLLLDSIKAELRKGVLADASSRYYNVKCKKCGWYGSAEFVDGGGQIADTGDYDDIFCPACGSVDLEDLEDMAELETLPRWETPEQWEPRTGEPWPDDWAVYVRQKEHGKWSGWIVVKYAFAQIGLENTEHIIITATEAGRPPDWWIPEEAK
jgi:hypothetical protein